MTRGQAPGRALRSAIIALVTALLSSAVLADRLDSDLNSLWEVLWDQRGTPRRLARWEEPVQFRVTGIGAAEHRARVALALRDASAATGIRVTDVSDQPEVRAQIEAVVVRDDELADNEPCVTTLRFRPNWALESATIRMRRKNSWRCAFHEVMHAMGIPGHPTGDTVLGYLSGRRDMFLELDLLMLRAWYSPAMATGATPLEAMVVLGEAASRNPKLDLPPEEAQRRVNGFLLERIDQLKALANGTGGVPAIVLRSGKASETHMRNAAREAAYYLGLAFQRGTRVAKDEVAAAQWFRQAAEAGHSPSQVLWGRALARGAGVAADPVAAYAWFARAARAGNAAGKADMERLEKRLSTVQVEEARAAATVSQATP